MTRQPVQRYLYGDRKLQVFRAMQLVLITALFIGLYTRNIGIIVNSVVSLLITFLPAYLERNHGIPLSPWITLWITTAVMLHTVGALGPYKQFWWYDKVTHTLSASIVAGVGYATVRAIDEYDDAIHLPDRFLFVFILLFVMAFGVFWEILEYVIAEVANLLNLTSVLTQYGLKDTIIDLVFDTVGALIFATLGTNRVQHVIDSLQNALHDHDHLPTLTDDTAQSS